jgi:magnesium chelatase family protein
MASSPGRAGRPHDQLDHPDQEAVSADHADGRKLLTEAVERLRLSARGYHRVLRVARTLADLDGAEKIGRLHLAEALSYRALAEDLRRAA